MHPHIIVLLARLMLPAIACLGTGGCLSVPIPQAEADATRFYVLSTDTALVATPSATAPSVQLRPVEVANYLTARALIVRRGDNEIEFREFARWGEPLDLGIARVLREELIARGAASAVLGSGARREGAASDHSLSVRVLACEGTVAGAVIFRAAWDLSAGPKSAAVASGDFRPAHLRWDGKTEASLAAQLSQAIAGLAAEIAAAVKK